MHLVQIVVLALPAHSCLSTSSVTERHWLLFHAECMLTERKVAHDNNGFDGAKVELWTCDGAETAKTWTPFTKADVEKLER